ncbi:hypothetical protein [Kribbella jiaozuonensis]|uniref:Uncharacterized protein n=1 Tax=Kribbella jiaozuonensis TaxID=2575441 RepID=A0A4U3LUL3_9ACTN|nr:hypothetical protein [Kribbella jiaozuonensis]TKK79520.1 hypothetical protein FDA38_14045 [Kribbella jiaozuonensis]
MTDEQASSTAGSPTFEDLAKVATTADLARCLQRLHRAKGQPSLRELENWGLGHGRPLRKSTLSDALTGKQRPSQQLMLNFLHALEVRDEQAVAPWLEALERTPTATSRPRSYAERDLGSVPAHRFFVEFDNVDEISRLIKNSKEQVWLLGTTLSMHVPYLEEPLRRAISEGRNVRIMLIRPGGAAMQMSVLRAGPDGLGMQEQEERLSTSLAILRRLATLGTRLEVRLIDYLAPYTLYGYDPGLEEGMIEMRLGSFHGQHHLRPTFRIERMRDPAWFEYFYEQFVSMWTVAEPYDLEVEGSALRARAQ